MYKYLTKYNNDTEHENLNNLFYTGYPNVSLVENSEIHNQFNVLYYTKSYDDIDADIELSHSNNTINVQNHAITYSSMSVKFNGTCNNGIYKNIGNTYIFPYILIRTGSSDDMSYHALYVLDDESYISEVWGGLINTNVRHYIELNGYTTSYRYPFVECTLSIPGRGGEASQWEYYTPTIMSNYIYKDGKKISLNEYSNGSYNLNLCCKYKFIASNPNSL